MVLVSVSIHEARVSSTFFGGLKASRRWKFKKTIILENIKSKGFVVTKFGGFRFFHLAHLSVVFTESRS